MIRNYIKTALRHFWKHKLVTAINVLGLAIGISATLVIYLMIQHDYSFDKHVPNGDRVYRIVSSGEWKAASMLVPLVPIIEEELPGIDAVVPFFSLNDEDGNIKIPKDDGTGYDIAKKEEHIIFTNPDYFSIFPHQWLAGNAQILREPHRIVLTESKLDRYFPGVAPENALGKTLIVHDTVLVEVGGVVRDITANTDFDYRVFISTPTIAAGENLREMYNWEAWNSLNDAYQCLLLLSPGSRPQAVEAGIASLIQKHKPEDNEPIDQFSLQPLSDIHFNADYNYSAAEPSTLRNLGLLAIFLLLLGAINFINLSTAQSIERAKEIGIRKSLGSGKLALVLQFLAETFVLTFMATVLSALLAPLLFQAFQGFLPKGLEYQGIGQSHILAFLGIQVLVVTLLAGFYPAWVMTGYQPALALKNQATKNTNFSRSAWVRKGLTISQFVIAQVLLICVLVVSKQVRFSINKDMGFRKEAIVNFYVPNFLNWTDNTKFVLLDQLKQIPEIRAVSLGHQSPAFAGGMTNAMNFDGGDEIKNVSFNGRHGDEAYIDVYGIPLVAGRNIRLLDSAHEVLINEKLVAQLGFSEPEEALGRTFENGRYTVVGVMKDFNIASVRAPIQPTMYWGEKRRGYVVHVALHPEHPDSWKTAIEKMAAAVNALYPENDFDYSFLDKTVEHFYLQDIRLSQLLTWAMGLSILIACLGLFGLAIFTANQRTKEIGIRKVLGATVTQIVVLLLKNVVALVAIACLIAFPIAWYFMHKWLEDFAFHTELSWWIFAASAIGMLAVAVAVLCIRSIQAARANPVESLRDE